MISAWMAGIAANVQADIELVQTEEGFKQITTTGGLFGRTVILNFKQNEKSLWKNPLTSNDVLISYSIDGNDVKMKFEHQDRDVVEDVHQKISGNKLTSIMESNKGEKAVFYYTRK